MKKILVIGGTGFIGFHIIKKAKTLNWKITSISKKKPKIQRKHNNVNYKFADVENFESLKKVTGEKYDYVVNAGGYGKHPDFNEEGEKLFFSHFLGVVNLVKILSKKSIKKFVQIGSSAEYGKVKSPQKETDKCFPKTPYAIAKYSCSNFLQAISNLQKFPVTILRIFLVYGPKQDDNRILPYVIKKCLNNKKFPLTKGHQIVDFCYIDDLVDAIFKTFLSKKTNGEIFNIGTGKPISIKKIVKLIHKMINKGKPEFGKLKYKKETNKKVYPNISKAKKKLKWESKVSLITGLKNTIKFYQ
tara:strand:- start:198 stop:1100 length:903 start_codon:yes stop_codon:yes gene_type:complete